MRRIIMVASLALAVVASAAAPVAAAETYQFRAQGSWANAVFTNVVVDDNGTVMPGDYFYTELWASTTIYAGDATFQDSGVCVFGQTFSVDADGNWIDGTFVGSCGPANLSVARKLASGHVTASLPIEECTLWDEQTKECLESTVVGSIAVDVTWAGSGPLYRYHGTSTGGTAGFYQYVQHGTGTSRQATPSGEITYTADGSATDLTGGLAGFGLLQESRDGYVDVSVGG